MMVKMVGHKTLFYRIIEIVINTVIHGLRLRSFSHYIKLIFIQINFFLVPHCHATILIY